MCPHLLKKSLMGNFIFYAVSVAVVLVAWKPGNVAAWGISELDT